MHMRCQLEENTSRLRQAKVGGQMQERNGNVKSSCAGWVTYSTYVQHQFMDSFIEGVTELRPKL